MLPGKLKPTRDLSGLSVATFAGGCFWCVEADFEKLAGVKEVISGYTGGGKVDPSYKEVSAGTTGHREAVQVFYDKQVLRYADLIEYFFRHTDPTDAGGSFGDRGKQYTSAIFYGSEEEKEVATEIKERLDLEKIFKSKIVTSIVPASSFYNAEDYHQNYHKRSSLKYKYYRNGSGRDDFLEETWADIAEGDHDTEAYDLSDLTELQYRVTQKDGTEPAFKNEYWDEKRDGIYVDVVSGEALFSSRDKYKSGTGWPSFTKSIDIKNIVEKEDNTLFTKRTEVRSSLADSHLGHVFNDGPAPTGERYCMNSAALRFVLKEDLEKEGHGEYMGLFE